LNRSHFRTFKLLRTALAGTLLTPAVAIPAKAIVSAFGDPVKTDAGYISGVVVGDPGKEVHIYKGIPYGAAPDGDLRWKPPQPVPPWKGVRKATEFGPIAAQYYANSDESQMSEDCLTLNVLTPAKTNDGALPVMVWLHPGGLDTGNGNLPMYNAPALPQHGVVLVTVNHRLGALGLLAHPELSAESPHNASGNYGMLDLIAALQWVKRNISAFGGDSNRVTIFGEGGGAQKVIWLLASPLAKGLFERAIIESGINRNLDDNNTRTDTEAQAYFLGERFTSKASGRDLAQLRSKSWQDVVKSMPAPPKNVETDPAQDDRMHLTIDAWSLPDHPINIFDEELGNDVPILIGGDAAEAGVFEGYTTYWLPALTKQKSNVYVYRFTHVPGNWKGAGILAPHGLEVRYQFDDLAGNWSALPGRPAEQGIYKDDEIVAENMMNMWAHFAATGDPSIEGMVEWPAFKAAPGKDRYVTIDVKPELQAGFLEKFKPAKQ